MEVKLEKETVWLTRKRIAFLFGADRKAIRNRGGLRIIYYWYRRSGKIYMLLPYKKSEQEDLTREQIKILNECVKEERYENKDFKDLLTSIDQAKKIHAGKLKTTYKTGDHHIENP